MRDILDEVPWCMLFVDYIVLIDKTRNEVYTKFSKTKTEYVEYKFNDAMHLVDVKGSEDIDNDTTHHIDAMWMMWRLASGVLCDKKVLPKLKCKLYRVMVRPTLLYETEC
ncbi:hypothetical protein H5410_042402 [Solanum commersonii]|uniref:Uncharacterized protein n=1 Tax=Solanum commersonii TaxID=4109 RepID=A0A9J5XXE7_SOLCO|nr:hypothetical protein H5410_042402 [Solanum commersonii]